MLCPSCHKDVPLNNPVEEVENSSEDERYRKYMCECGAPVYTVEFPVEVTPGLIKRWFMFCCKKDE